VRKAVFFRSFWLRAGLGVLIWTIALIALLWVLHQKVANLQRFYFSDCLFGTGTLLLMAASLGMMSRPFEISLSPWGRTPLPVQDSEEERSHQALAQFVEQRAFALRMAAIGLILILVSAALAYLVR
jgi:hypothetical protein